jgi:type II restriction/modification system DNA methylase subunit YeeA
MDTGKLKKFAQAARRDLMQQVGAKLAQVLAEGSLARREQVRAVGELEKQIQAHGRKAVVERAAYTWFNRLTALRFMDANGYNQIMAVSPAKDESQPEILAEAKKGHINEKTVPERVREQVFALLDGRAPSRDPQAEAYRLLLVAVCNYWHQAMPFMFERISDWTELLMPDDLLSDTAVRTRIRSVLTAEDCQDVEVIGWLYQFYISEKKDEVFAGLKKGKKISAENIPAATQLFTPHWIVRYLVENSLGRLWLLNRPNSRLAQRMDYYIAPEEPETDFLKIDKPEDIKLCDPACGSGHMLTYAFDLLYAIYEEEGYAPDDIPALILAHNLTGIEIDERAGALAAFALAMKAAEKLGRRKFLKMETQPNIVVLQDVRFSGEELEEYMAEVGRDLFTADLRETLGQFEQAKNFGSLIQPSLKDPDEIRRILETKSFEGNLFLSGTHQRVLDILRMTEALSPKYHVVVANPPYMAGKGMNKSLKVWLSKHFEDYKADLFSAFVISNIKLAVRNGYLGFMTPFTWMFITTYENLRLYLLERTTITSLVQLEYSGFSGATVPVCIFTVGNQSLKSLSGSYIRLTDFRGAENQGVKTLEAIQNRNCGWYYETTANNLRKLPGTPIAYWANPKLLDTYSKIGRVGDRAVKGLDTGGNIDLFLKRWFEISLSDFHPSNPQSDKWFPIAKGGDFRRWYGNHEYAINYAADGAALRENRANLRSQKRYFRAGLTWTVVSSGGFAVRYLPKGFLFDQGGSAIHPREKDEVEISQILSFLNSKFSTYFARLLCPTLNFTTGDVRKFPIWSNPNTLEIGNLCLSFSERDWNSYETSWDFTALPLLAPDHRADTLENTYTRLRTHWQAMTDEMQRLEEENNRIFIDAYDLAEELTPEVPIEEITLTCNPAYRYGVKISEEEREKRLLADTMAEFLSYAVGCMFGRYSLDKPGLVLANQGERLEDYLAQVPEPRFMPDEDNVIPILDDDWFTDDITERFRDFLRLTFGEAHFQENLEFIEQALGKPVRKYFLKDFYKDHVQRYKKRPIYWLFSSPKGSFNALIYMHRYRPDTVSVILNDYLREFRTKLGARIEQLEQIEASAATSARDKTAALKEIKQLRDTVAELEDWERKVLLPLAAEKIEIDLDDGVKANYPKFGAALAKVPGLSA